MKRLLPLELPATDAVRAQVVLAALRCGQPLEAAGDALLISADGLRSWLGRFTGTCAWPPEQGAIEDLLRLPIAASVSSIGPVSRLAAIAESMAGLPPGSVAGRSRTRAIVRVRQAVAWAIRQRYGAAWSYPMIGRALGGRDHSTVVHAMCVVEDLRARDGEYAAFCDLLVMAANGASMPAARSGRVLPDWAIDPDGWIARRTAEAPGECAALDPDAADYDPLAAKSGMWCEQCDALVGEARGAACERRFCSLRAVERQAVPA